MEKKCIECDSLVDLKAGDEISPEIGRLSDEYGPVELCRSCFSKGWSVAIPEDFINDPNFTAGYVSPIQLKDL